MTVGVEEELMLLDPATLDLAPRAREVLEAVGGRRALHARAARRAAGDRAAAVRDGGRRRSSELRRGAPRRCSTRSTARCGSRARACTRSPRRSAC